MTSFCRDATAFKDEVITGFAAAYGRYARRVPGAAGFVRRAGPHPGKVSLVVGGGSGHYPSYAGIVGTGLADACVMGDVFTSPSSEQVYRIGRAASGGAGVVLAFGNYAGDRLNFGAAAERLDAAGIETRIVYVTDDVASAPVDDIDLRRGIAGTLVVYKVGGSAADAGYALDDVARVMAAANDATATFGVAFGGCTLPGRDEPLFRVEPGMMELGLGIHGEPGVRTAEMVSGDELAGLLVDRVLADRNDRGRTSAGTRAAVLVNGLGATKYEELFVLYGGIDARLRAAGIEPVLPEVGEFVTSLDMAGCSLTVSWLDDELAELWAAPADTASFRRAVSHEATIAAVESLATDDGDTVVDEPASDVSVAQAEVVRSALRAMLTTLTDNERLLGDLDAVAGDGDHGLGMTRGARAACDAADSAAGGGVGTVLRAAGDAFGDRAGGTSGILWGILLSSLGESLGNTAAITGERLAAAAETAVGTLRRVGRAEVGDKTMLDAIVPFVEVLGAGAAAGDSVAAAWTSAADAAVAAAAETAGLRARVGRARPLAERSIGTPDPGATSFGLIATAIGSVIEEAVDESP